MGRIEVAVTESPLRLEEIVAGGPDSSHGAGNLFVGFVRDLNLGRKVVAVEYDCFAPLAEKTFAQIAAEAQVRWGSDTNVLIVHRHGRLSIGEASVAVYVTTRHRDESYAACRYAIEEIKTRAPIWKNEHYESGQSGWVRGHALCKHKGGGHDHLGDHPGGGQIHPHGSR